MYSCVFFVTGLLVNFFSFIIFTSQQVQAIAEAGQLPRFIAYRHPVHGAPIAASVCSSVLGLSITMSFAVMFGINYAQVLSSILYIVWSNMLILMMYAHIHIFQDILVSATLMPAILGECISLT
jgi:amino acid transporter